MSKANLLQNKSVSKNSKITETVTLERKYKS